MTAGEVTFAAGPGKCRCRRFPGHPCPRAAATGYALLLGPSFCAVCLYGCMLVTMVRKVEDGDPEELGDSHEAPFPPLRDTVFTVGMRVTLVSPALTE